jgi:sulfite reductase (NADPH) flavoprotein alpha-component
MEGFLRQGVLTELHTAFSREHPSGKKVYVQDRMLEQGDRLCRLLVKDGAYLYVCGDAENMARDVHGALKQLLVQHGGGGGGGVGGSGGGGGIKTEEDAEAFLNELKQRQRYVLDIWS